MKKIFISFYAIISFWSCNAMDSVSTQITNVSLGDEELEIQINVENKSDAVIFVLNTEFPIITVEGNVLVVDFLLNRQRESFFGGETPATYNFFQVQPDSTTHIVIQLTIPKQQNDIIKEPHLERFLTREFGSIETRIAYVAEDTAVAFLRSLSSMDRIYGSEIIAVEVDNAIIPAKSMSLPQLRSIDRTKIFTIEHFEQKVEAQYRFD